MRSVTPEHQGPRERPRPRRRLRGAATMLLYQLAFLVGLVGYAPVLVWRGLFDRRYWRGFGQRMGYVDLERTGGDVVWIHGVSVGEVKAANNIIERLRELRPELQIVLSATTPNGHHIARLEHPDLEVLFYPLDFGRFPGRALDRIRPQCVLLMELEIWPNFLLAAARRDVPVAVINGRISERTFRGYRRARGLLPQLDIIRAFCVQDSAYRGRLLDLGVNSERVFVTGNMKYDSVIMGGHEAEAAPLRDWLAEDGRLVLVAGSTHGDEDVWLCKALDAAGVGPDQVRVVLVPRHPERAGSVCDAVQKLGRRAVRWTESGGGTRPLQDEELVVVDTIGLLQRFYAGADLAFVGGSLVPHGGQNMLEPAAQGRAVVFGPHTANFRTDVDLLLQAEAAVQVGNRQELGACLRRLIDSPGERARLGAAAQRVIADNQGATQRTLERIGDLLGPRTVAPEAERSRGRGSAAEVGDRRPQV